jgi:hypothetical protein
MYATVKYEKEAGAAAITPLSTRSAVYSAGGMRQCATMADRFMSAKQRKDRL